MFGRFVLIESARSTAHPANILKWHHYSFRELNLGHPTEIANYAFLAIS